jgi:hypothetical protein
MRPFQQLALNKCDGKNGIIVAPGGIGKSLIGIAQILREMRRTPSTVGLFVTVSDVTVNQVARSFQKYTHLPADDIGVLRGHGDSNINVMRQDAYRVYIVTYTTLCTATTVETKLLKAEFRAAPRVCLVLDEVHRAGATLYMTALHALLRGRRVSSARLLGLTACFTREGTYGERECGDVRRLVGRELLVRTRATHPMKLYTFTQTGTTAEQRHRELLLEIRARSELPAILFVGLILTAHSFMRLARRLVPELRPAVITGNTPSDEKEDILRRLQTGECNFLIGTYIICTGYDITGRRSAGTMWENRELNHKHNSHVLATQIIYRRRPDPNNPDAAGALVLVRQRGEKHEALVTETFCSVYREMGFTVFENQLPPRVAAPAVGECRVDAPPVVVKAVAPQRAFVRWRVASTASVDRVTHGRNPCFRVSLSDAALDLRTLVAPGDCVLVGAHRPFRVLLPDEWRAVELRGAVGNAAARTRDTLARLSPTAATMLRDPALPAAWAPLLAAFAASPTLRLAKAGVALAKENPFPGTTPDGFVAFVRHIQWCVARWKTLPPGCPPVTARTFACRPLSRGAYQPARFVLLGVPSVAFRGRVRAALRGASLPVEVLRARYFHSNHVQLSDASLRLLLNLLPRDAPEAHAVTAALSTDGRIDATKYRKQFLTALRGMGLVRCKTTTTDGARTEIWYLHPTPTLGLRVLHAAHVASTQSTQDLANVNEVLAVAAGWFSVKKKQF